jgi:hypothetical protein
VVAVSLADVELKLDILKTEITKPVVLKKIVANEPLEITIPLETNLHDLIKSSFSHYTIDGNNKFIINILLQNTSSSDKKWRKLIPDTVPNPWHEAIRAERMRCTLLLKNMLNEKFSSWEGNIEDDDEWTWFTLEGFNFQYRLNSPSILFSLDMDEVSYTIDSKKMLAEIKKINSSFKKKIKLKEEDNHFSIDMKLNAAKLKKEQLSEAVSEMLAAAKSPELSDLINRYKK